VNKPATGRATAGMVVAVIACLAPVHLNAQASERRIGTGFGVDTLDESGGWNPVDDRRLKREIFHLWRSYLLDRPDSLHHSPYWSPAEQRQWPEFDLTRFLAYQGLFSSFQPTVLQIEPVAGARTDEFVVKTLFARVTGDSASRVVKPIALSRIYVARENGRWVLANALPRLTATWPRRTHGQITFVVSPEREFDPNRARVAAQFADSLAATFGLPVTEPITYYVTNSGDEAYRIMGFDWAITGSSAGAAGKAFPENKLIISGNAALGEAYLHEIAHIVLQPIARAGQTHHMLLEGLATWAGGTQGTSFEDTWKSYSDFLRSHPEITLDAVLSPGAEDNGVYPAGAILVQMAYDGSGVEGVKRLMKAGRSDEELRRTLSEVFARPWSEVMSLWRAVALNPRSTQKRASH
jgi:hypothetical protein